MSRKGDEQCFLCRRNRHAGRLEVHHIFGAAMRSKSDALGLTVTLCEQCHRTGEFAVHRNAQTMLYLHRYGQKRAMEENGWTAEEFRLKFGKNYLEDNEDAE